MAIASSQNVLVMRGMDKASCHGADAHKTIMKTLSLAGIAVLTGFSLLVGGIKAQDTPAAEESPPLNAEEQAFLNVIENIDWEKSGTGKIGQYASIKVPEGYVYTGGPGTIKLMETYGNLTSGGELGYIAPDDFSWFAVFEFDECGYVKDDEKGKLDAKEIMKEMVKGQTEANKRLKKLGMPMMEVVGWHTEPFYNSTTNNLEWAIRLKSEGAEGETINYKTKLLGRRGVMEVVLVCNEQQLYTVVPEYQKLLAGYEYASDQSYAAFEQGDRIAEYGLTGLIVGGGLLAAAKTGLLAKLWKPIAGALLVVGAFIKRLFGRKSEV
jgi:uncharacterized membrane-anchored protein